MCLTLRSHRLQHTRLPCPPLSSRVCSNSRPLSQLCLPTISSSVAAFSSYPHSFPASGSVSQFFASGAKDWSFSFSITPSNEYSGLISFKIDLISLQSKGLKSLLQHHSSKASILQHLAFFMVQLSHPYMTTGKTIALTIWTFVGKVMPLLFNMLPRFVIAFLPRSRHLLISWLQSPSAVILEPKKTKSVTVSTFFYNPTSEVAVAALCSTPAQKPAAPNVSPKTRAVQKGQVPPAASGPWATARLMSFLLFPAIGLPRGKQKKHVCDCTGIVLKGCSAWEHPPSWRLFMRKIKAIRREYVPHSNSIN